MQPERKIIASPSASPSYITISPSVERASRSLYPKYKRVEPMREDRGKNENVFTVIVGNGRLDWVESVPAKNKRNWAKIH